MLLNSCGGPIVSQIVTGMDADICTHIYIYIYCSWRPKSFLIFSAKNVIGKQRKNLLGANERVKYTTITSHFCLSTRTLQVT